MSVVHLQAGVAMSFYSVYLVEGMVELYPLKQEYKAIVKGGCLISTQKDYQSAREVAMALAQVKQLPLADYKADGSNELGAHKT